MKKRLALAVAALVLAACALTLWLRHLNADRIDHDSYYKFEIGMTREQVEDILGGPPRVESQGIFFSRFASQFPPAQEWWGTELVIFVSFDGDGKVSHKRFENHSFGSKESEVDRIRRSLGL
jgi:hypothetical protein